MDPWINEFHYDNVGTDEGEFIELVIPLTANLSNLSLVLYNGNDSKPYDSLSLANRSLVDAGNGFGILLINFPPNGIQNGSPDGIALIDGTRVVQFISYEGTITAVDGSARSLTSIDIGVQESGETPKGSSLSLTGTGANYGDFRWQLTATATPGAANTGQSWLSATQEIISISGNEVVEGNAGETNISFVVTRTGAASSTINLNYQIQFSTTPDSASIQDFSSTSELAGSLVFTAGETSKVITVRIQGDTQFERDESFKVVLSSHSSSVILSNGTATGVIRNDDSLLLTISQIQGAGHQSVYAGMVVMTTGIVTAVDSNGFYIQDPIGDANPATSDGLFVYTASRATVTVGDALLLTGQVVEYQPGGTSTNSLTITELDLTQTGGAIQLVTVGNPLPPATVIGHTGRLVPSRVLEDDNFAAFEPASDGLDFWESLESMLIQVPKPLTISPTVSGTEIWVVADSGVGTTGLSERGTLNVTGGASGSDGRLNTTDIAADFNPERLLVSRDAGLLPGFSFPTASVGSELTTVTGVLTYGPTSYALKPTQSFGVAKPSTLGQESTSIGKEGNRLLIASYNVHNLDPNDQDGDRDVLEGRFLSIAKHVVQALNMPDILALQEVQDNDGSTGSSVTSASVTLQTLVDAIAEVGGPRYVYVDNPFIGDDRNGGEPGGNIRTVFLYNPSRVQLVQGSLKTVLPEGQQTDAQHPFYASRPPLVGEFIFQGQAVQVINVHLTAKSGSSPLEGVLQPPINAGEAKRIQQAEALKTFVTESSSLRPGIPIIVLGDFNELETEEPMRALEGDKGLLENLTWTLQANERYSFIFDGNSQSLDHILVSRAFQGAARYDAVHVNTEFSNGPSDHDPVLASLLLRPRNVKASDDLSVAWPTPVQPGSGTISLKAEDGTLIETFLSSASQIKWSDNSVSVDPSIDLGVFKRYLLEFDSGSVKDSAGILNDKTLTFQFQTATIDSLYHFFVVAFAAAPGATYMGQLAEALNYGLSLAQIVEIFTTKTQFTSVYPATMSNRELATQLVNNIVKDSASVATKQAAIDDIDAALGIGWSRGKMLFQVFGNLASKPLTDPVWGGTAKQFQNQLAVARYFTEEMGVATETLATLRGVIGSVTPDSDVSTVDKIVQIIGTIPPGG
jgi:predicted extracellular nuclease